LNKINFEPTLKPYLVGVGQTLLRVILYVSVIGMVGIQTTSFIAVLGAAGLAVGMALQGSLSNFAGSVLLLLFKPIRKGDLIVSAGDGRGRANNDARAGTIIGKALADFDGQDGVIEVVVGRV
jgi:small conductance mechanosensitive channel